MERYQILNHMDSPKDLQKLSYEEISLLSGEIRDFLIENVSKTGGHLASNLGTVELTLAIHRVFESPADSIVWDVGHQAYTHKILTGRKGDFHTLRQPGGISGFPKPSESVHDAFTVGHSSTSISAAYAISRANQLKGDFHHAIAVIGDGAFTGGLAYEALNNAGRSKTNLVILLNHNTMSISRNVGAFARYLATIRAKPGYLRLKQRVEKILDHTPLFGEKLKETLLSSKSLLKYLLYHSTFFEELGFAYFGPVDGHDVEALEQVLKRAKQLQRPAFVHIETVKGKGYQFAEKNPLAYHGISKFDVETGNPDISTEDSFSSVFGQHLAALADYDNRICAITAAMKAGTGLTTFCSRHRSHFFDVGIAEQHAVTFSAGLASKGLFPVFAVYSTFLQRAYDQILHDAAIDRLHIILAIDRAGIVGDDGETHQGIYDVAFLTSIPGVTIFSPASYGELRVQLERAIYQTEGVVAVRYPRGAEKQNYIAAAPKADVEWLQEGNKVLAVSYGRVFQDLYAAAKDLPVSILKLNRIYPLEDGLLAQIAQYETIIFYEEAVENGSITAHMLYRLHKADYRGNFFGRTLPNDFIKQGHTGDILAGFGLDSQSMKIDLEQPLSDRP